MWFYNIIICKYVCQYYQTQRENFEVTFILYKIEVGYYISKSKVKYMKYICLTLKLCMIFS